MIQEAAGGTAHIGHCPIANGMGPQHVKISYLVNIVLGPKPLGLWRFSQQLSIFFPGIKTVVFTARFLQALHPAMPALIYPVCFRCYTAEGTIPYRALVNRCPVTDTADFACLVVFGFFHEYISFF
jgi:hypothetical protein